MNCKAKEVAIIIDLDGTLCNNDHRQHFLGGEKKDWDGFFGAEAEDTINNWCEEIIDMAPIDVKIIFLTGRKLTTPLEETRTYNWLSKHFDLRNKIILGREPEDYRKDYIIKEEIYRAKIEPHYDVIFAIDDRKSVVDMWRKIGLVCLQCADHTF